MIGTMADIHGLSMDNSHFTQTIIDIVRSSRSNTQGKNLKMCESSSFHVSCSLSGIWRGVRLIIL